MRNGIWVRILNVLNLKYERLVHNSAKVVSLQVFGKFSVFPPYDGIERVLFGTKSIINSRISTCLRRFKVLHIPTILVVVFPIC